MKPFGEPAPRNFDKERPGPGWQISDATLHEIEMLERHMRAVRRQELEFMRLYGRGQ